MKISKNLFKRTLLAGSLCAAFLSPLAPLPALAFDQPWNGGKEDITSPNPPPPPNCTDPAGCSCPNKPGNLTSPVYAADGSLVWSDTDIVFPTQTGIQLKRTYNSFDYRAGLFGRGWVTEQEVNIARTYKAVTEANADGSPKTATEFESVPIWLASYGRRYELQETATECTTPEVLYFTFQKQADGRFKQVYEDSHDYSFYSATGQLLESYDDNTGTTIYYEYDADNRLVRQIDSDSFALNFTYNDQGFVSEVRDQADRVWTYAYSDAGTLTQVTNPDGNTKDYIYQTVDRIGYQQYLLTDVSDNGDDPVLAVTWADRVIDSNYASAMRVASYTDIDGHRHDYTYTATTFDSRPAVRIVKDTKQVGSNSTIERQTFTADAGNYRILRHVNNTDNLTITRSFDSRGNVLEENDERGNITRYAYNEQGRRTSITELADTNDAKVTTFIYWNNTDRIATMNEYGIRETRYTYDSDLRILTETQVDLASNEQRVTTYTYHPNTTDSQGNTRLGQMATMDGPQTGAQDTTRYQYNAQGQIRQITYPLGHTESYAYNSAGQQISETDKNGIVTSFTYNSRNQLISSTRNNRTVSYQYNGQDQLTSITDELGRVTRLEYDEQNQPSRVTYPSGDNLRFTYNYTSTYTEITEQYYQADNTLISTKVSRRDAQSKLPTQNYLASTSAQVSEQQYNNFNEITRRTRFGQYNGSTGSAIEHYTYDSEGRLTRIQDAGSGSTQLVYDSLDRLTQVTDANNGQTQYSYNAWGEIQEISSPDTGVASYQMNANGNLVFQTNANNQSIEYEYDAQNRLINTDYAGDDLDIVMTYDQGQFSTGLLSSLSDGSGSTGYQYDDRQLITQISSTVVGVNFLTSYQYNDSEELTNITYPSGIQAVTTYDDAGRLSSIVLNQNSTETSILHNITWHGASLKSHQQGNGLTTEFFYDNSGRLIEKRFGSENERLQNKLDNQGQITQQTWVRNGTQDTNAFQYNNLGYLFRDGSTNDNLDWLFGYDRVGNRISQRKSDNSENINYSYEANSNRLSQIGTATIQRDAAGNTLNDGIREYRYNAMNRLSQLTNTQNGTQANYTYNYLGQRVRKQLSGSSNDDIRYVYGQYGELLGEYNASGNRIREYIYRYIVTSSDIRSELITNAQVEVKFSLTAVVDNNSSIYYVHTDHLETPRLATNHDQTTLWRWVSDSFGFNTANEDVDADGNILHIPHRFPGQYYDWESGLHYNSFRYYEPYGGRYVTSDPIGLLAGFNTYIYVLANPVSSYDLYGLKTCGSGWNEPFVPDNPLGYEFSSCCAAHDNCYDTCGSGQANCDNTFYQCMDGKCKKYHPVCKWVAKKYYDAVKEYGTSAYDAAQDQACDDCNK